MIESRVQRIPTPQNLLEDRWSCPCRKATALPRVHVPLERQVYSLSADGVLSVQVQGEESVHEPRPLWQPSLNQSCHSCPSPLQDHAHPALTGVIEVAGLVKKRLKTPSGRSWPLAPLAPLW